MESNQSTTSDRIAVNIGNSRISCGLFKAGKLLRVWHHPARDMQGASGDILATVKASHNCQVAICSVVPSANEILSQQLLASKVDMFAVTRSSQKIIEGTYETMGADRIATAAAAFRLYPSKSTTLVFDFGTATTLTAIDTKGEFLGGLISLGLGKTFDALHVFTGQLPDLKQSLGTPISSGIGQNTASSIITGCVLAHVGLFKHWLEKSKACFSEDISVVVTGGYTPYLTEYMPEVDFVEPNLTLIGIDIIAEEAMSLKGLT
jgi:type III pantothenate kinase